MDRNKPRDGKLKHWGWTALYLFSMALLLVALGWLFSGWIGVAWVTVLGFALSFFGPKVSNTIILKMYRARPLPPVQVPLIYQTLEALSLRAAIPKVPVLYYIPSPTLNAFTLGRAEKDPVIALTDGLLRRLGYEELTGVLAHEISHIHHKDLRLMAVTNVVNSITSGFSAMGKLLCLVYVPLVLMGNTAFPLIPLVILICSPMLSLGLQTALARNREFFADQTAAELTGDASGLANALSKLEAETPRLWTRLLKNQGGGPGWLQTHPSSKERIRRLRQIAAEQQQGITPVFR